MIRWTQIKKFKDCKHGFNYRNLELFDEWEKGKNLTHFTKISFNDYDEMKQIIKLAPGMNDVFKENKLGILDHMVLFKNKQGDMWLTSQPYTNDELINIVRERLKHIKDVDVKVYDESHSWYNSQSTCLIVFDLNTNVVNLKGMTGEELLYKVRSLSRIRDIHWQVKGDVLEPEEVKVIVVTDEEKFKLEYSLLGEDEDPLNFYNAAIALLINKFMEQIGEDLRFSVHDELYQAINEARKRLK